MFSVRLWVLVLLLPMLFLSACTRSRPVPIQVTLQYLPQVPFEISSQGRAVNLAVSGEPGNQTASFPAEGRLRGDQFLLPQFTMRLHYPCGWRDVPLHLDSSWAPEYVRQSAEERRTLAINTDPPYQSDAPLSVDIDNRGSEVQTLDVGELSYKVEKGHLTRVSTYQPDCGNAALGINGKSVGNLPAATKPADPYAYREGLYAFVDPTARRCYQLRQITYSSISPSFGPGPKIVQTLRGRQLCVLEYHPKYVLTSAPGSIMSQAPQESQYELTEKKCQ
jgi:hypothetical protein